MDFLSIAASSDSMIPGTQTSGRGWGCVLPSKSVEPIVISAEDCVISPTAVWVKLGRGYDLLPEDKCLIESGMWLNDCIINAWQLLLQKKYVHIRGFHPTVLTAERTY